MNRWVRCIFYDEILFSCIRGESPIPAARRMNHKNVLFSGIDQKGRFHACEIPRTGDSINSRAEERRDWTVSGLKTYLKLNRRVWMASWMYLHSTKILNTIKAHFTLHECCCNQKGKIPCHFFFFKTKPMRLEMRCGSLGKSTDCSSRGPVFDFQCPHAVHNCL